MTYPSLLIDRKKFQENASKMVEFLKSKNLDYHLVTKAFCAWPPLIEALHELGIRNFADSRIINLKRLRPYSDSSLLTRIPQISEAAEVVEFADISLNSELATIQALNAAAKAQNKVHKIIVMLEMGDLREGMPLKQVPYIFPEIMDLEQIEVIGIGANFNCYGGVIPDFNLLHALAVVREDLEHDYERKFPLISGGNSGSLHLLLAGQLPPEINHLRIGEAYLLGRETSYGKRVLDLHEDVFTLRSEIIEIYDKPSVPRGKRGLNAAGERTEFIDQGIIKRGICAMGGQDVVPKGLRSLLPGVELLGNSQDHTIFKLEGAGATLDVGDQLDFSLNYVSLVQAFTSEYVNKELI
ncbi:MAG: alanine racemase [Eubacteriales bacterium]|nr:alanine racemase [Eubacteriales bacterium]